MLATRHSLQLQGDTQTENEGMKRYSMHMGNKKQAGAAILLSDKTDFYPKRQNDKGHYITLQVNPKRGYNKRK